MWCCNHSSLSNEARGHKAFWLLITAQGFRGSAVIRACSEFSGKAESHGCSRRQRGCLHNTPQIKDSLPAGTHSSRLYIQIILNGLNGRACDPVKCDTVG
ncbi:hypothetical protein AAFF_G00440150 [Aldrovandia affinis]|uniref:Uncharacterized protein n=1 Tax=Aldrovandia affinis TaxID=143900 RepID=A0AAD7WHF2_9TELE|nr:hypothetical protein AAFF_G00440150 [Aldrovandia affinis]